MKLLDPQDPAWKRKFRTLRSNAHLRNAECLLTFVQYLKLAKKAGLTDPSQVGRTTNKYHMARLGDTGDYEWGKWRFITMADNIKEKLVNGGADVQAMKMRGRTAKTHAGVARTAEKIRGRTKATYDYLKVAAVKQSRAMRGRTKENNAGVASMVTSRTGRTKETHAHIALVADKLSRAFKITSPSGKVYEGKNLTEFCRKHSLNPGHMSGVLNGKRTHHKNWSGKYA